MQVKVIVNNIRNEYCIYDDYAENYEYIIKKLEVKYEKNNIYTYETTSASYNDDMAIEKVRGNKKVNLADWL